MTVLQYSYCMRFESSLSLYQCTLLPICTVAKLLKPCASIAVQLLYAIRTLTVTISVHTVTNMYGSQAVKAMCQYCSTVTVCDSNPHCHYISAHCYQYVRYPQLLKPCASIAVHLLYEIRILTVTISVHTVTNVYGCHNCSAMFQYCSTVTV